ncbi:hypothetical protein LMG33818_001262 [Halomonadaceae bacterium LMG 33818]|uniref:hypothetical protein n=1 Tax=Cernens ardua TaxID=3402176 RepID=UPI003EDC3B76
MAYFSVSNVFDYTHDTWKTAVKSTPLFRYNGTNFIKDFATVADKPYAGKHVQKQKGKANVNMVFQLAVRIQPYLGFGIISPVSS